MATHGRKRFYAIHLPVEHRCVHHCTVTRFDKVILGKLDTLRRRIRYKITLRSFDKQKDADYFRDHGHDKDFVRKCSARCVNVPKELQRLLQESQVTDSARDDLQGTTTSNDQNHPFWAVAVGKIPGIYMDNLDTLIQVDQFSGHQIGSFATLAEARTFLHTHDLPDPSMRSFGKHSRRPSTLSRILGLPSTMNCGVGCDQ
jgi:hypothetical protein